LTTRDHINGQVVEVQRGNARKHLRVSFETDVELEFDGTRQPGRLVNVSLGGAFVETKPCPPINSRGTLYVRFPKVPGVCEISSVVRWSKNDRGVGLQFLALRPIEVWAVNKIARSALDQNRDT